MHNYQPWYNLLIKVHPNNPNIAYWGTTSLWRTLNGGSTVDYIAGYTGSVHPDFHDIDFYPNDQNKIIVVSDGGVYRSDNQGNSWTNLNSTLTITQFYSVSADPQNADNVLGGTQDNGLQKKYSNYSHEWSAIVGGDFGTVTFNPHNSNYVLGKINNYATVYLSTDNGNNFPIQTTIEFTAWLMPIVWHPTSENIAYTAGKLSGQDPGILRSTNYGASWLKISQNFPTDRVVEKIAISKTNPSILFASTGHYDFWPSWWSEERLYRSTDGGQNWTDLQIMVGNPPKIPKRYISSIAVNPTDENEVFLTVSVFGSGHVWRSQDRGNNWTDISGNIPEVPINDLIVYVNPGTGEINCIAATDIGVFITTDMGTWIEVGEGLPNSIALDIELHENSQILRTATHGRGVWEINLSGTGGDLKTSIPINRFYLYNNDPNPFNPLTKIRFQLPTDINVTVKVYDIIGREVATLVNNEFKKAGIHTTEWDASNNASGVYFYRLIAGCYIDTKRMILVK